MVNWVFSSSFLNLQLYGFSDLSSSALLVTLDTFRDDSFCSRSSTDFSAMMLHCEEMECEDGIFGMRMPVFKINSYTSLQLVDF